MDLTARLLRAMTAPAPEDEELQERRPDLSKVSGEDLGTLMPAAYAAVGGSHVSTVIRFMVEDECRERQPRYTPDACRRLFEALVGGLEQRKWADLTLGAGALLRCTGPWPDVSRLARTLVEFLLDGDRADQPFALLAIAGLAGDDLLGVAAEPLRGRVNGPIGRHEIDVVTRLSPPERMLLTELDRGYSHPPQLPDLWERIATLHTYAAFARRALEAAAGRARAIQTGEIPYRADKAFASGEVEALGRAARVVLSRDEPWLPAFFDRLLPHISIAPTQAKTLPSQALLYEIVRAAQDFPTPELVTAIRTVRRTVRHAGVPKQLDKMLKKVEAALAERTDVALRLPDRGFGPDGVLRQEMGDYTAAVTVTDKAELTFEKVGKTLKGVPAPVRRDHEDEVKELRDLVRRVGAQLVTLARALEGGYTVDAAHPFRRWRDTLVRHPIAGPTVRRLIWEVETGPGEWRAVLPEVDGLPDAAGDASVRLWHPLRSEPDEVRAWRDLLVDRRIRQPFKQAFVGVTSIAADPMWKDGEAHAYWVREWYADLGESTQTRRDALERILPRTKIADRCSIDGRYLTVRGELRTYKIHLGSANIVMEPDDAFLCIVPERRRSADAKVFLPFEEERLSLILSKAFLLAADHKITDESILMQIKRGA